MAEYIKREDAYEDFEKCNSENPKWTPSRVKTLIARQKAADVTPVRHGRWDIDEFGHYCTVCREYGPEIEGDAEIVDLLKYGTPYCHNCGAKMDLEG